MHQAALAEEDLLSVCKITRTRRSGPGGQHRNKVETAIVVTHLPTGICGEASERRSQAQNRRRALHRLRVNLALEIRGSASNAAPSSLWVSRLRGERIAVNQDHADFPALLAEALDAVEAESGDVRLASERLRVTPSQLIKLLQLEPRALDQINRRRAARGLHRLR